MDRSCENESINQIFFNIISQGSNNIFPEKEASVALT